MWAILLRSPERDTIRAAITMELTRWLPYFGALPTMLLFPPVVSFLILGTATILSIFKPWHRTPWSREPGPELIKNAGAQLE
jgi:hypothetical protein